MKPIRLLGLSILSGILLAYSWPAIGISYLIFFAWIPLLLIAEAFLISRKNYTSLKVYGYAYLSFLIWNVGATWWVKNASFEGALMAFLANSALMAGVFTLVFNLRRRFQVNNSIWLLLPFWLGAEYLHHDWDLSWPWLTLGNVFAGDIQLIQWYEFTGTGGGSLWILTINILLLQLYRSWTQKQMLKHFSIYLKQNRDISKISVCLICFMQ
jgi:apolipoprotein N-acyltransferase